MNTINFNGVNVPVKELINLHGRRVKHCWPRSWTRIEFPVSDFWSAADCISQWIENNLPGGKYGIIIIQKNNNFISKSMYNEHYTAILGFERETDAIMFKLLDGHITYSDLDDTLF